MLFHSWKFPSYKGSNYNFSLFSAYWPLAYPANAKTKAAFSHLHHPKRCWARLALLTNQRMSTVFFMISTLCSFFLIVNGPIPHLFPSLALSVLWIWTCEVSSWWTALEHSLPRVFWWTLQLVLLFVFLLRIQTFLSHFSAPGTVRWC